MGSTRATAWRRRFGTQKSKTCVSMGYWRVVLHGITRSSPKRVNIGVQRHVSLEVAGSYCRNERAGDVNTDP